MIGLLILGFGLGFFMSTVRGKVSRGRIAGEIELQDDYIQELEETIDYYKNGLDETLEQNIYLRKELSKHKKYSYRRNMK